MTQVIILIALLYGVWLALSGHYTTLLLTLGFVSSVGIALLARRMRILDEEGLPLVMAVRFLAYLPWLVLEAFRSSLTVARIILSPDLPIDPVLHRFQAATKTDLGRFLFGNSITFTPGTTTCDIEGDEFLVYAISREGAESLSGSVMERKACHVEGSA